MQQSNVIFGMLLLAYFVYITSRGELPVYLNLIRGSSATGGAAPGAKPASTNPLTAAADLLAHTGINGTNDPTAAGDNALTIFGPYTGTLDPTQNANF